MVPKRNHHALKSAAERRYLRSPQRELWVSSPTPIQPRSGDISNEEIKATFDMPPLRG